MTTDEVKEYLWQARKIDDRLQRERRNLEKLRSSIEYHSPSFDGAGGCGEGDKIGRAVANIMERAERVDELATKYIAIYEKIEQTIHSLHNDVLEEVLELRYLQYLKWNEVTERMGYEDVRWTQRLHGRALKKLQQTIESHV